MDDYEIYDVDDQLEPEPRPVGADEREGVPWGAVLLLLWAVLLIVFSVQNADDTTVDFLAWSWSMPVALLVMITALATLVLTGIGSVFYRRKRRRRREVKRALRSED
ncbi:MAG TPA: LapA family protein [Acidimicrobiia bacterium]